jgi:hypothetical protein
MEDVVGDRRAIGESREIAVDQRQDVSLLLLRIVADQADLDIVARLDQHLAANAQVVVVLRLAVVVKVGEVAVAMRIGDAQADRHLVGDQRRRGGYAELVVVVIAQRTLGRQFGVEARLARGDVDRAGRGVLTEQRALRSMQHFDLLQVDEVELGLAGARIIDAVEIEADTIFEAVDRDRGVGTQAADVEVAVARIGRDHL